MIRQIAFSNSRRNALSVDTLHNIKQQILAANTSLDDGKVYLLPEFKPSLLHSYLAGQRDETSSWFFDSEMFMKRRRELPKVLVLSTEGPVFSSGHDLHELCRLPRSEVLDTFRLCSEVMTLVMRSPQVVITRVQGLATAASSTSIHIRSCDCILKGLVATPGVNIGCTAQPLASLFLETYHPSMLLRCWQQGFRYLLARLMGLGW
ncbi:hypothetical protein BC829DRAFT_179972 [Chytridium lagenaria]|nr:hypothetical protein BC829DRAFT_179972 [Chytridium lagenaria]